MRNEPVAIIAVIRALAVVLGLFGIAVTDVDVEKIITAVIALYAALEVLTTIWQRSQVSPVAKVRDVTGYDMNYAGKQK